MEAVAAAASSAVTFMAVALWRARAGARERRRRWGARREGAGASGARYGGAGHKEARGTRRRAGAQLAHGRHARGTRHALGHFREQLAGDGVDMVGSRFGPSRVRIGLWA